MQLPSHCRKQLAGGITICWVMGQTDSTKVGRVETTGISIFSLQQESAPILSWLIIHPTFAWQSPESQSIMLRLPKSPIESVIAVASYTQIPRTSPNSGFLLTCSNKHSHFTTWKSSAFLFRRSFSLGWTSPSATFEPRCVSRCVIGEMMPQMASGVLKKRV